MIDNENEVTKTDDEKVVLKDEVFPYPDGESEIVYKDDVTYDENMSTAWSFLGIGAAGFIFTLLNILGVLNIMQGFMQKGVAALLFLGFMIYGIIVIRSKKDMLAKVEKEKADRKKYTDWMKEKFTEEVLSNLGTMEASAEEIELLQINYMSEELVRHFPEINPNFADRLAEDFFEEKE